MAELNAFLVYNDNPAYYKLSMEQRGKLFTAMLNHSRGLDTELSDTDPAYWVFESIRASMDARAEKYAERCARNARNGRKGGRPKMAETDKNRTVPKETDKNRTVPKETDKNRTVPKESERFPKKANVTLPIPEPNPEPIPEPNPLGIGDARGKERKRFEKPTAEQVAAYAEEKGLGIEPQRFIDHYEANGWMVGRTKMKDWKAAARNWSRNDYGAKRKGATADDFSEYDVF